MDLGHEDGKEFLVTMDVNRTIILRDLANPREIICEFKAPVDDDEEEEIEFGIVQFFNT